MMRKDVGFNKVMDRLGKLLAEGKISDEPQPVTNEENDCVVTQAEAEALMRRHGIDPATFDKP